MNLSKDPFIARPLQEHYLARAAWIGSLESACTWAAQARNVDAPSNGRTPLLWAISRGHLVIMDLLLKKGADITKKTKDGDNALACAVWSGNPHMVQLMLDKGFDPAEKGTQGKSALDWAEVGGNAAVIQLLRDRATANAHARALERQRVLKARTPQKKIRLRF